MDKKTIAVVVLCVVILVFWTKILEFMGLYTPASPLPPRQTITDTSGASIPAPATTQPAETMPIGQPISAQIATFDSLFSEKVIAVNTPKYELRFTNRGGGINKIVLKEYNYRDNGHVILAESDNKVVPDFEANGQSYRGGNLPFVTTASDYNLQAGGSPQTITYTHENGNGGRIIKKYTINPDTYDIGFQFEIEGIETFGFERSYHLIWDITPPATEHDRKDDYSYYMAVSRMGGEKYEYDDFDDGKMSVQSPSDFTEWVGLHTKYFTAIMVARSRNASGVIIKGAEYKELYNEKEITARELSAALDMQIANSGNVADSFMVYAGPLDYDVLKRYDYGLEDMISLGWIIIKPFSIGIIWLLPKLYGAIPNYGIVVLIFALLIKIITFPLTKKQTMAMAKMKDLQPKMKTLQEKYKNDPQKLNKEMMKLYKEAGANPLSGCLPMLPQMPIFFALFTVFKTTIEFRGAHFFGWITDLSVADPYYVLPIIMMISMFVQQKMTMTDPKHKMMIYMMPLLFGYLFMSFPAGLVLYWTGFNILSLAETMLVKKQQADKNPQVMDAA